MNQIIKSLELKPKLTQDEFEWAFQYRSDRSYKWLQKLCFWILRKLKAFHQEDRATYITIEIDTEKFIKRLFQQRESIARCLSLDTTHLLIGHDDFVELMEETKYYSSFSFVTKYGYGQQLFGLKVIVVPWMQGFVLLTKDIMEQL